MLRSTGEIHVKKNAAGDWVLEVLGAPYSGPDNGKDLQGDFFSENTDFMTNIGDRRPVLYYHGETPEGQTDPAPQVIGVAEAVRRDERGLWFEVTLDKAKNLAERIWSAAVAGIAAASSGSVGHLVRRAMTGELLTWPIAELTLLDVGEGRAPANPFATVAVAKAVYDEAGLELPEALLKADEAEGNAGDEFLSSTLLARLFETANRIMEKYHNGSQ